MAIPNTCGQCIHVGSIRQGMPYTKKKHLSTYPRLGICYHPHLTIGYRMGDVRVDDSPPARCLLITGENPLNPEETE